MGDETFDGRDPNGISRLKTDRLNPYADFDRFKAPRRLKEQKFNDVLDESAAELQRGYLRQSHANEGTLIGNFDLKPSYDE